MEGLSVRSVFMNVFVSFIVLLYLINNETSMMIIISNAVGLLIEVFSIIRFHSLVVEDHQGCQDSLLLEGKQACPPHSRQSHLQYQ